MRTRYFKELPSTNDYLKQHADTLEDPLLIYTGFQTKGRGRRERRWASERDQNFLGSFLIKDVHLDPFKALVLASLTLIDTLSHFGIDASIKLPNDIYSSGGKIAGILIERLVQYETATIIGIGLNVNERMRDEKSVSIADIKGKTTDVETVKDKIVERFEDYFQRPFTELFPWFRERIDFKNMTGYYDGRRLKIDDIDDKFHCYSGSLRIPCYEIDFSMSDEN